MSMANLAQHWLHQIRELELPDEVRIMNVCGGHERSISMAGLRGALPDKIRLIPGHCDPTVNLYDWYVCIRDNRVEQLWPITARGAVY